MAEVSACDMVTRYDQDVGGQAGLMAAGPGVGGRREWGAGRVPPREAAGQAWRGGRRM